MKILAYQIFRLLEFPTEHNLKVFLPVSWLPTWSEKAEDDCRAYMFFRKGFSERSWGQHLTMYLLMGDLLFELRSVSKLHSLQENSGLLFI